MTSRLLFLLLCLLAMLGCVNRADLTPHYDEKTFRFCEVTVGLAPSAKLEQRQITIENEGGMERRSVASLCASTVTGELALDDKGRVQLIVLTRQAYCMQEVCIGDSFRSVRARQPKLELFLTREEGGILALRTPSGAVRYSFVTGNIPGRCFERIDACPDALQAAKVVAIVIGTPNSP